MKTLFTIQFFLATLYTFAQCEPPIVTHWNAENDTVFTIDFLASEGASEYVVTFVSMYTYDDYGTVSEEFLNFIEGSYSGSVESGLNSVSLDPTITTPYTPGFYANYYYKVKIATICSNDTIWGEDFYMSTNSLLNDDGLSFQNFYQPFAFLPDAGNEPSISSTQVSFEVGDNSLGTIENMSIFLDIGHSFVSDLTIELTSPAGTTISLLPYIVAMNNAEGFSVLFEDGAPGLDTYSDGLGYVRGIFSPEDSFSAFYGEDPLGTWTLTINDNFGGDFGFLFGIGVNFNESPCDSYLAGNTYFDMNSNGINDEGDLPYQYAVISSDEGTMMVGNEEGDYYYCFPQGNITVQLENIPTYYTVFPENFVLNLSEGDQIDSIDFTLQPIAGIQDLSVDMFHYAPDRPGFENYYYIDYVNLGTECVDNVSLVFSANGNVDIVGVEGNGIASINDTLATIELGTLCPFESGSILVTILVDASVQIGDELTYLANISPTETDNNVADNSDTDVVTVVGAFDPNDKMVNYEIISPEFLSENNSLEYLIRFQNTGNYYAENVVIRDVLDADLIPTSLMIKDASHSVVASVYGNELVFEFNDILLPASEDNEVASHGFVRFTLQPEPSFSYNDIIENTGNIIFDFNEPIVTNTVTTILGIETKVDEENILDVDIYPNPTSGIIHLRDFEKYNFLNYQLNDLLGNEVQTGSILSNQINLKSLSDGIYSLKLMGAKGEIYLVQKIVIEK